ncbi:helix-turn-helix domain-containing protein [Halorhodospira halophila]|uniref:helix-turn-helix domain-containing protein n=1 Tax=Halorhodospira halophila TaxID=1053 RepID=UPI001F5C64DE|nr:helix-turn-helix domain-containing protein [Halorhodospira halophila]
MNAPQQTLGDLPAETVARLLKAAADIALIVDAEGTIHDVAVGSDDPGVRAAAGWRGRQWREVVGATEHQTVDRLLVDQQSATLQHIDERGNPIPVRYRLIPIGDGRIAAVGRDLRPCAALRQQPREHNRLRSIEQTTALVGQVPLRDLVREATDLIERMCIETALNITHDNRASAAELLGLSRQSLYSKLRRHGLMTSHNDAD